MFSDNFFVKTIVSFFNFNIPEEKVPVNELPDELIHEIFTYLNGSELNKCCQVSKKIHKIANHSKLWHGVVQNYAFGEEKWKKYFGMIDKVKPLPHDILNILKSPCPFFKGQQVGKSHMLVWIPQMINGKKLTLKSIGALFKEKNYCNNVKGYDLVDDKIENDPLFDKPIEESCWALMSRKAVDGSEGKSYREQIDLIEKVQGCEVPKVLLATACIFAEFASTSKKLFGAETRWHSSNYLHKYTRCIESLNDCHVVVGGFGREPGDSLCLDLTPHRNNYDYPDGVASCRKLF